MGISEIKKVFFHRLQSSAGSGIRVCGVFNGLVQGDTAPESWSFNASIAQREEFRRAMESAHPIFRLCDNRWKSDLFAKVLYPTFKQAHTRRFDRKSETASEPRKRPTWLQGSGDKKKGKHCDRGRYRRPTQTSHTTASQAQPE